MSLHMLVLISLIVIIFYAVNDRIQRKYFNFVLKNSVCLKKLQEINRKYKFSDHISFD